MPVLADIKKTQEELSLALAELDNIEAAVSSFERSRPPVPAPNPGNDEVANQLRDRVEFLNQENRDLSQKNEEILRKFDKVNTEKEKLKKDIAELRSMSQKLQVDVGKVNEEKTLLSAIVKNTQDENKVLSKVMEKITSEYEELKKVYEGMKCPKDDKIQALRSTARALETENELLMEEKRKIEGHSANIRAIYDQKVADLERENRANKEQLKVGFSEKKSMLEQIERMESEKIGMKQQLSKLEKDLASAKKEIEKKKKK